jgi:hypothetical protein
MRSTSDPGAETARAVPAGELRRADSAPAPRPAPFAEPGKERRREDRRDSFLIILLRALGAWQA